MELIEAVVRRMIKEQRADLLKPETEKPAGLSPKAPEDICFEEASDFLGTEGLAAIANTMSMFRGG